METGDLGALGVLVVQLVEVEPRPEQETVTLLLPQMEALLVLGQELKVRLATKHHAQSVCITKISIILIDHEMYFKQF
jgi:hypothetical protein